MISRPLLIPVQRELHLNQLVNWLQLLEQKASCALTLVTQNMAQGPAANDNTRVLSKIYSQALFQTDQVRVCVVQDPQAMCIHTNLERHA